MTAAGMAMKVQQLNGNASVIAMDGEVTAATENPLTDAYTRATEQGAKIIILDFSNLVYMNSSGIGLLVTTLIRANRQKQKLCAVGLNEHYRQIFELTQLDQAIGIYPSVEDALAMLK